MAIDFKLSSDDLYWQEVALRLGEEHLKPHAIQIDREATYPHENFAELFKAGLMSLLVPEELGGQGANILTSVVVIETLAQFCGSTAMCYHMHNAAVVPVVMLASNTQIDKLVIPLTQELHIFSYAVSEPGSGSRWWHMDGSAEKHNSGFRINASKSFVTSAGKADFYVILVRASPSASPDTLSAFVIPKETPGISIVGEWDGLGMRGNSSTPMKFEDCDLSHDYLLGDEGLGFLHLFQYAIPAFLIGIAAVYLGIAQSAYDYAVSHVTRRVHTDTGLALSSTETVQRYISEMKMRLDQARLVVYRTANLIADTLEITSVDQFLIVSQSEDWLLAIGEAKVIACEAAAEITSKALQVCGGTGYSRTQPLERYLRDARAGSIMGPNDDSIKLILGQRLLGLPFPWEKAKNTGQAGDR